MGGRQFGSACAAKHSAICSGVFFSTAKGGSASAVNQPIDLEDVPGGGAGVAAVPIVERHQSLHLAVQPRLLADFLDRVPRDALQRVAPTAGKRPATVVLMDEEDASGLVEEGRTGIDFRGLEAHLVAEKPLHRLQGVSAPYGHHLGGDVADALEAFGIEGIFGVSQPRLGQELQLLGPRQPTFLMRLGHERTPFGRASPRTRPSVA